MSTTSIAENVETCVYFIQLGQICNLPLYFIDKKKAVKIRAMSQSQLVKIFSIHHIILALICY